MSYLVLTFRVLSGNGPSGIVLSYMLSGHWPYYVGQSQDEFLHARLMVDPHLSLVQQDLQFLSEVNIYTDCFVVWLYAHYNIIN